MLIQLTSCLIDFSWTINITNNPLFQPPTRTQAIWMYGSDDIKRISASQRYPNTVIENSNIFVDDIRRPNLQSWHGKSPRIFLEELKYPMLARQIQAMNRFPVGRPRTEEVFFQLVNEVYINFDTHIIVDSRVDTPFPLYYSELYVHGLVNRVKKEVRFSKYEDISTHLLIILG